MRPIPKAHTISIDPQLVFLSVIVDVLVAVLIELLPVSSIHTLD